MEQEANGRTAFAEPAEEDIAFAVENCYTIDDYDAYWTAFRRKSPGRKPPKAAPPKVRMAAAVAMVVYGAAMGVGNYLLWQTGWLGYALALTVVTVGLLRLFLGVPEHPRWVRKAWANHQKAGWRYLNFRFTEEFLEIAFGSQMGDSVVRQRYTAVRAIWEDEGHFYLDLGPRAIYMLQKAGFARESPVYFAAFLQRKTERPVKWVNGPRP